MTKDLNKTLEALERTAIRELHDIDRTPSSAPPAARRYDFTALSTAITCPRRYVYEYVLGLPKGLAKREHTASESGEDDEDHTTDERSRSRPMPPAVMVGKLFHKVVENQWPESSDPEVWKDYAGRLAAARGWEKALSRVETLIDAFFDTSVSAWEITSDRVEVQFSFEMAGRTVTGFIDAVPLGPKGEFVVLDFKTGASPPDEEQLLIYLLATHRDESLPLETPATTAAFLTFERDEFQLKHVEEDDIDVSLARAEDVLQQWIAAADTASYDDPRAGRHCGSCPYRSVCDAAELSSND